MNAIKQLAIFQHAESSAAGWAKWLFLAMALLAFYCMFNGWLRNAVFGEFYKLRFMKRTGSPASVRTAAIAFIGWSGALVSCFFPRFWEWDYSGVLFIGLFIIVMVSSYFDALSFRKGNWR